MESLLLIAWLLCGLAAVWLFLTVGERISGTPCPPEIAAVAGAAFTLAGPFGLVGVMTGLAIVAITEGVAEKKNHGDAQPPAK